MQADTNRTIPARLQPLAAMGLLLQGLDHQPRGASAEQYRGVVGQVSRLIAEAEPGHDLDQLLQGLPVLAEVYENLNYTSAGLCRSPLDSALNAEVAATAVIAKARRPA